ncbi:MAG TPA: hypothetical protein VMT28_01655 [Terriglobales bacterium]|nr:hypothetical protein [Terriglobales bacterium]
MNRASILASLPAQGAVTDEQFALASWAVVSQRFSHFCYAGNAASGEVYDPLRLLRGYGFACCEQVARVLAWLWEGAGYEARLASMKNFHTVPEIYYQGAWHMYDPDHKVYYLARDNQTVADVAMAKADPYLVARTADANGNDPVGYSAQWMADQYAAAEISYWTPHYTTDTQYTLRPSESFTLSSENLFSEVLYARLTNSLGRQAPRAVTSGQYDWALDFSQPNWSQVASSSNGVTTLVSGWKVFLTNAGSGPGYVVYSMSSAFPVFHLRVSGLFYRADSRASIKVYFSADGSQWSKAFPATSAPRTTTQTSVDLSSVAQGADSYFVKIELCGVPGAARVAALHIASDVQVAKILVPPLIPGAVNHLVYEDWGSALDRRNVEVALALREFPVTSRGTAVPLAIMPATKTSGATAWQVRTQGGYLKTEATFRWSRNSDHHDWSFGEPVSGLPWDVSWFVRNQPIPSAPARVSFVSPSDTFWVLSPRGFVLDMVGQPSLADAQAVSSVAENPSFLPWYAAHRLVDGDLDTLAYPGSNHLDYVVSLRAPSHVSTVSIRWGHFGMLPGYVQSWTLYGRNGAYGDWQPLAQGDWPHSATTGVELDQVLTDLRIVADGTSWIGIFELTVAGAPVLSGLTATSNILELPGVPGYQPTAQVTDGDDSTLAYVGSASSDYTVNLPPSTYVDAARIVWGSYGTSSAYVKHWRLYGLKPASSEWQVIARGGFPGAPETRVQVLDTYEKLRIAAESDHAWIGIYELQVFGVSRDQAPASTLPSHPRDDMDDPIETPSKEANREEQSRN